MAHKTITISEEAYEALSRNKHENESFTETILRMTSARGKASSLFECIQNIPKAERDDLATNIETAMIKTRKAKLRKYDV